MNEEGRPKSYDRANTIQSLMKTNLDTEELTPRRR
jgi:hypothetical protein